jgi:2-polyprenyl-3-methyl-5-hydroxy-6-metoxy-1,4-benzoquinol methylase
MSLHGDNPHARDEVVQANLKHYGKEKARGYENIPGLLDVMAGCVLTCFCNPCYSLSYFCRIIAAMKDSTSFRKADVLDFGCGIGECLLIKPDNQCLRANQAPSLEQ